MITEFFMDFAVLLQGWFLGLFGDDPPPLWITDVSTFFADVFDSALGLGAWVPFPLLGIVIMSVGGLWATFWIVKGIRWVWGLTPFSGGS